MTRLQAKIAAVHYGSVPPYLYVLQATGDSQEQWRLEASETHRWEIAFRFAQRVTNLSEEPTYAGK